MNCPDCGVFYEQGTNAPNHVEGCPNQERPYGDQPSPIHSEMSGVGMPVRDIPGPGVKIPPGGNPLQEGILGGEDGNEGWQPAMKRDESFASVARPPLIMEATDEEFMFHVDQVIEPGPHTVEVDAPGVPIIMQHSDPEVLSDAAGRLGKTAGLFSSLVNGIGNVASDVGNAAGDVAGDVGDVASEVAPVAADVGEGASCST